MEDLFDKSGLVSSAASSGCRISSDFPRQDRGEVDPAALLRSAETDSKFIFTSVRLRKKKEAL